MVQQMGTCGNCKRTVRLTLVSQEDHKFGHEEDYETISHHIHAQWDYSCNIKDTCPGKCLGSNVTPTDVIGVCKCTLDDMCYPCWCDSYYKPPEKQRHKHSLMCERCE